jgi:hypothetical protein
MKDTGRRASRVPKTPALMCNQWPAMHGQAAFMATNTEPGELAGDKVPLMTSRANTPPDSMSAAWYAQCQCIREQLNRCKHHCKQGRRLTQIYVWP